MISFKQVATVNLHATAPTLTGYAFIGQSYSCKHRDPDFDTTWFSKDQFAGKPGKFAVIRPKEPLTLLDLVYAVYGKKGDVSTWIHMMEDHVVALAQIEDIVRRTDCGEDTGLRKSAGHKGYFFIRAKNRKNGGVALVIVERGRNRLWRISVSTCGLTSKKLREGVFFFRIKSP